MDNSQHNYKLIIAYDGTHYSGWQIQPNATSIQELIQRAIKTIIRQEVTLIGSGRTDSGVHALGQVAHFKCNADIDLHRFLASINGLLPRDIRVLEASTAPLEFHAQRSAARKTYHYHLCLNRIQNPFKRLYSWHLHEQIDLILLQNTAKLFVGTHDFTSFANEAHAGCAAHDPVRTIEQINLISEESGVCLEFTADGFLYKMVRNIVGTLVEVASGKFSKDDISKIFAAKDRRLAGRAAPPHGLFLMHVDYSNLPEGSLSKDE